MKRFALFAAFALWATPAFAQTASVSQTGNAQTASVTQTGSASNEAIVQQISAGAPQASDVLQSGVNNLARVRMETDHTTSPNSAFLRQVGDHNDLRQTNYATSSNGGQSLWAEQRGDRNVGVQEINTGYTESLTLEQRGDRNDARQYADGGGHNHGDVLQVGDRNLARQTIEGQNYGYGSSDVQIEQRGNLNEAYQTATGGAFSMFNNVIADQDGDRNESRQTVSYSRIVTAHPLPAETNFAEVDQNGSDNYARQDAEGGELYMRVRQDGDDNWSRTAAVGNQNYLNARMSDGAYLRATQTGNMNNLFGTGGAGTEARILNGSSLTMTQTGDMNSSFVNMVTGGTATISQIGNSNTATVIQN